MKIFNYKELNNKSWDNEIISLISQIQFHKGKQALYLKQKPEALERLIDIAKIQSVESSNKIEGIVTASTRIKQLIKEKTMPKNRDEEEILGYRDALKIIHESYEYIPISLNYILHLHQVLYSKTSKRSIGGKFKAVQNYISSTYPDGHEDILFTPLSPFETPDALQNLCNEFNKTVDINAIEPLLLIPIFILDFICIHPFSDGNGRMSRLLTTLLLYRLGYEVGKYISLENLIEKNKDLYYSTLSLCDKGWLDNTSDPTPFIKYLLRIILSAYIELEERLKNIKTKSVSSYDIIKSSIDSMLGKFNKAQIQDLNPTIAKSTIELYIKKLVEENYIKKEGAGKATFYHR